MKYEKRTYKDVDIHLVWIFDKVGWLFDYNNEQYGNFITIEPKEDVAIESLGVLFLNAKESLNEIHEH